MTGTEFHLSSTAMNALLQLCGNVWNNRIHAATMPIETSEENFNASVVKIQQFRPRSIIQFNQDSEEATGFLKGFLGIPATTRFDVEIMDYVAGKPVNRRTSFAFNPAGELLKMQDGSLFACMFKNGPEPTTPKLIFDSSDVNAFLSEDSIRAVLDSFQKKMEGSLYGLPPTNRFARFFLDDARGQSWSR
jgi:hypothetical protein